MSSAAFPALTSPRTLGSSHSLAAEQEPMPAFHDDAIPTELEGGARIEPFAPRSATRRIGAAPAHGREKAFAKAKRRSARVRLARLAIPIGGLGAVVVVLAITFFNPFATKLGSLSFGTLSVDGTKIVMDHPKLAGFRSDGQAYSVTAERALQDVKQPTVAQLQKVDGEMGMADGEPTHLSSDAGVYDSVGEHMELSGNVRIKNTRFTVLLRSARFDFKSGVYGSDENVEVQAGDGTTIFADRAAAINHGQELTFEGHVRTRIVPQTNQRPTAEIKKD
jgi:lipopolysaccharide export system protein LptC